MRALRTIFAGLLLAILSCTTLLAQRILDLRMIVKLQEDGTAYIYQRWDVLIDDDDSGTEWYVPVNNMDALNMEIKDFQVYDMDNNPFVNEGDDWVSRGRTREQKAGRCGRILYSDGSQDLCWGFGTTGRHVWYVGYTLTNLIQRLEDGDAFIHQFINDELPGPPEYAKITVEDDAGTAAWIGGENVKAWSFGFDGDVTFDGNSVIFETDGPMSSKGSMILMMQFEKGMYSPKMRRNITLDEMKKTALKGSSYRTDAQLFWDSIWENIELVLMFVIVFGSVLFVWIRKKYILATGKRWKEKIFGESKIEGWWREVPLDGSLDAAYGILTRGDKLALDEKYDNGIVGAYFLRWIENGILTVVPSTESKRKDRVDLALTDKTPSADNPVEMSLYQMVVAAAGENRILERNEFQMWSRHHYTKVCEWPDSVKSNGAVIWNAKDFEDRKHIIQLRNFLQDFTLSNERAAVEVKLWKEYLVYAALFGIADKVAENFSKLYPAEFKQVSENMGLTQSSLLHTVAMTNSYANLFMYTAQSRKRQVEAERSRSSGGGGRSSFGGGGGFSGGGHGGGTR